MPVRATLPAVAHDDDEEDDDVVVDGVAGLAGAAGDEPEPEPDPLLDEDDESLVDDVPELSPLDDEALSPEGAVAAVREDEPRLSVL